MRVQLTVLFQAPFWVAIVEREDDGRYAIAREVFGGEPSHAELREWVLRGFRRLVFTEIAGASNADEARKVAAGPRRNPKRAQREAACAAAERGVGTRAEAALKAALELRKQERCETTKAEREAEAMRRWALRREKRKEKHRGH
jgi:hypothetical protein